MKNYKHYAKPQIKQITLWKLTIKKENNKIYNYKLMLN